MNIQDVVKYLNTCDQAANYGRISVANGEVRPPELLSVVFKPYPCKSSIHEQEAIETLREHGISARPRFITVCGDSIPKLREMGLDLSRIHNLAETKFER
jgi:hypothetical protein